jgi:hypothetical protein
MPAVRNTRSGVGTSPLLDPTLASGKFRLRFS